ncbi:hypothetical protein DFH09DRAFT_1164834 [Mycena vulgaris]|nr:hypothetical protein DFH09DRAFT_1164834 [Mycena vulgaris]
MRDRLPDELISEILSPALNVPEDMFRVFDASQVLPFASSSAGSSSTLLVCKSWQHVATPFL